MERRGFLHDLIAGAVALASGVIPYGVSHLLAPERVAAQRDHLPPPEQADLDRRADGGLHREA